MKTIVDLSKILLNKVKDILFGKLVTYTTELGFYSSRSKKYYKCTHEQKKYQDAISFGYIMAIEKRDSIIRKAIPLIEDEDLLHKMEMLVDFSYIQSKQKE